MENDTTRRIYSFRTYNYTIRAKPRKSNYYTIAFEYLNQVDIGEKAWNTPDDVNIKPMSLWYSNDKSYFISYNSKC